MTDRHECDWGPWHPWCAQYRCIYPGCYKNIPSDEVARRLNAYSQLEKGLAKEKKRGDDFMRAGAIDALKMLDYKKENEALREHSLPIKVSDGDVWLIFPGALISIDGILVSKPGPIVERNLRKWRDALLKDMGLCRR